MVKVNDVINLDEKNIELLSNCSYLYLDDNKVKILSVENG